jgi:hypothetical protein
MSLHPFQYHAFHVSSACSPTHPGTIQCYQPALIRSLLVHLGHYPSSPGSFVGKTHTNTTQTRLLSICSTFSSVLPSPMISNVNHLSISPPLLCATTASLPPTNCPYR